MMILGKDDDNDAEGNKDLSYLGKVDWKEYS